MVQTAPNKQEASKWAVEGLIKGATHVIIVCDTFSHEDYPVYVMPGEDADEVAKKYSPSAGNMQQVHEVIPI